MNRLTCATRGGSNIGYKWTFDFYSSCRLQDLPLGVANTVSLRIILVKSNDED